MFGGLWQEGRGSLSAKEQLSLGLKIMEQETGKRWEDISGYSVLQEERAPRRPGGEGLSQGGLTAEASRLD